MPNFILKSMGCKSNQFEGQILEEKFINNGFVKVDRIDVADFYILNSCTGTHKSDNEALYMLRNVKKINPKVKTILTGCVAQVDKLELEKLDYIDYLFGNDDKFDVVKYILNDKNYIVSDIMLLDKFNEQVLNDSTKTRMSLKIQDGCDNRCSYCIIPFARGKSRSANEDFIKRELNKYNELGYKEIVFTGIHIGQWGKDCNKSFLDFLELVETTPVHRYRLGSLNPTEIPLDVLNFLKQSDKFCPHFHLSLQSACDKTLLAMNRFYKTEEYLQQIEYIYSQFDKPFIGCDIIAGFVGETEEDFETTVKNLQRSKLSKIHTFPYSIRKDTKAEKMTGHLTDKIKEERAKIIKKISEEKTQKFLQSNIGEIKEVLIEKRPDKSTGMLKGVSENYINVMVENATNEFNTLQKVKIDRIENNKVIGFII